MMGQELTMPTKAVPLMTVITPTYNRANYIRETIESVLGQKYPSLEYIVLDDGSTDETRETLREYEDRLTWVSHPNVGEAITVNKGLHMASGEYILVVNSDDPVLPGLIEAAVACFLRNPDLLVVYPDWILIDEQGNPRELIQTYDYDYFDMVRWHHCFPGPGAVFRRKAIELEMGRDTRFKYVGDFDFWLRLGLHGPFKRLPSYLATFRIHAGSASISQVGVSMAQEHILLLEDFFARSDLPEEVRRLRNEAYSSAYYIAGIQCHLSHSARARSYFAKSLSLSWRSRPNGHPRSLALMMEVFLIPSLLRRRLRTIYSRVKHAARRGAEDL